MNCNTPQELRPPIFQVWPKGAVSVLQFWHTWRRGPLVPPGSCPFCPTFFLGDRGFPYWKKYAAEKGYPCILTSLLDLECVLPRVPAKRFISCFLCYHAVGRIAATTYSDAICAYLDANEEWSQAPRPSLWYLALGWPTCGRTKSTLGTWSVVYPRFAFFGFQAIQPVRNEVCPSGGNSRMSKLGDLLGKTPRSFPSDCDPSEAEACSRFKGRPKK